MSSSNDINTELDLVLTEIETTIVEETEETNKEV